MKQKNKKKIIIVLFMVALLGLVALVRYFNLLPYFNKNSPVESGLADQFGWKYPVADFPSVGPDGENLIAYSSIRDPGGIPRGLPVRLIIPAINVNSAVEDAYITPDGRMDVPAGTVNVAWFALGPHPGKVGSAVIGGHFGEYQANKGPTVFFNLDKLVPGDKVYIEDDSGKTLAFVVTRIELFDRNADSTRVFTSDDGVAHLNLITCEGIWNKVNDTYPDRRVVFTDAIPFNGSIDANANNSSPTLPTTAETPPTPIASAQPEASAETQPSPITTAQPEGTNLILSPPASTDSNVVSKYLKILFGTPMDAVITSLLIISILAITVKVIRK